MLPNVQRTDAADHVPVLADEVRELLDVQPGETVVDATFGAGGHSRLLAADLQGAGKLVAIDRDPTVRPYFDRVKACVARRPDALPPRRLRRRALAARRRTACRPTPSSSTSGSRRCRSIAPSAASRTRPTRRSTCGWTRPTSRAPPTSWRRMASASSRRSSARTARSGTRGRSRAGSSAGVSEQPIDRTGQLVDVVRASIPAPARFGEGHPAKRVFQALRIEVNHELESLEAGLPAAFEMLRPGGRLAVISFHSLEDRIAKRFLRDRARGCTCPPELPVCVCGHEPELRLLTPKPVRPSAHEIDAEPACRVGAAAGGDARLMSAIAQAGRVPRSAALRAERGRRSRRARGCSAAAWSGSCSSRCCSPASWPSTSPCSA